MLSISASQQRDLSSNYRARYIQGLRERLAVRNPELVATCNPRQLRMAVEAAVEAAEAQGFTQRGPIRLYLDVCIAFGSGFIDDPMYPWAREAMGSTSDPDTQTERAEALFVSSGAAFDAIRGPRDEWMRTALAALLRWVQEDQRPAPDRLLGQHVVSLLASLHPQKAAYVGEMAMRALVSGAAEDCATRGVSTPRVLMVLSALKFTFGANCLGDPVYGWIAQTLADQRVPDAAARFSNLERNVITWLKAVLAGPRAEGTNG